MLLSPSSIKRQVFNVEREERVTTARKQIVKIAYEAKE
jgi:hypothetical protein